MAKVIDLSKGYVALVDDEDYARLKNYRWSVITGKTLVAAKRNTWTNGKGGTAYMHADIMGVKGVDHVSHALMRFKIVDNRKTNLRVATPQENSFNRRKKSGTYTSKYKGVYWKKDKKKYVVDVKAFGKVFRVGSFDDQKEAALAYDAKAVEFHGAFALTNAMLYPEDFKGGAPCHAS